MKEKWENLKKVSDQAMDACSGIDRVRFSAHYWCSLCLSGNKGFVKVLIHIIHTLDTI